MTLHTARRRWRALSCAALAATIVGVGCRDDLTSPTVGTPKHERPSTARHDFDPGGGESPPIVTIPLGSPDIYDGSVTVSSSSFGFYTYPTTVKVTISGGVETYTPNFDGIGPAQGPFTAPGRLFLGWTDGPFFANRRIDASGMFLFFFGQSNVFVASRSALGVLTLDGFRPPGSNQFIFCGPSHGVPCFQVGGDAGTLTLERLETDLAVTAEFTEAKPGDTPFFDYRSSPQFASDGSQLQWVVASSSWTPDSVNVATGDTIVSGPGRAACQTEYDPACRRLMKSSGTFKLSAFVNGKFATKSVHVHVTGPRKVVLELDKPGFIAPDLTFGNPKRGVWVSVKDADGNLVPNVDVALRLEGIDGTGGHAHTNAGRPIGSLPASVNTTGAGRVKINYTAPNVAGDMKVTGSAPDAADGTLTLKVGLTGLVNIRAAMPNLTWNTPSASHPDADWGLPLLLQEYQALSSDYLDWRQMILSAGYNVAPYRLPARLGTNDVSLQWGGRLDFKQNWINPHISHRQGYEGDWDVRTSSNDDVLADAVYYIWTVVRGNAYGDERASANHVHLKMSAHNIAVGTAAVGPQSINRRANPRSRPSGALAATDPASSFWPRRDQLQVTVSGAVTALGGDHLRISYTVQNAVASAQPASVLVIRSDVNPDAFAGPDFWLPRAEVVGDSSSVAWFGLGSAGRIAGGASASGFTVDATGLLGLTSYRVVGYAPNPSLEDFDTDSVPERPGIWDDAASGVTIGVVPIPAGSTSASLGDRLGGLLDQLCALGWVDSKGVCNSLQAKLDAARSSLSRGNSSAARGQLGGFENEVNAQAGKHVTNTGASLLVQNVEAILRRL